MGSFKYIILSLLVLHINVIFAANHQQDSFCEQQKVIVEKTIASIIRSNGPANKFKGIGAVVTTYKLGRNKPCFYSFGQIGPQSHKKPDAKSIFGIASITKTFVTTILALKHYDGEINMFSSINPYLPKGYKLQPQEKAVTFQQLATFTGGFYYKDPPGSEVGYTLKQFIDAVNRLIPKYPILGRKYLPTYAYYSNSSICLLGQVLMHIDNEKTDKYPFTAQGFSAWVANYITTPLHMKSTSVHPQGEYAIGSIFDPKTAKYIKQPPYPWVPFIGPAASLRTNATDMAQYLKANICAYYPQQFDCHKFPKDLLAAMKLATTANHYTPSGKLKDTMIYTNLTLLDPKTNQLKFILNNKIDHTHTTNNRQALAWQVSLPTKSHPKIAHDTTIIWKGGEFPGFNSWIGFSPSKQYGVVILMNTGSMNMAAPVAAAGISIIRLTSA